MMEGIYKGLLELSERNFFHCLGTFCVPLAIWTPQIAWWWNTVGSQVVCPWENVGPPLEKPSLVGQAAVCHGEHWPTGGSTVVGQQHWCSDAASTLVPQTNQRFAIWVFPVHVFTQWSHSTNVIEIGGYWQSQYRWLMCCSKHYQGQARLIMHVFWWFRERL
jgi:hypothetical protein